MADEIPYCRQPCAECPWRTDAKLRKFPAQRFRDLAATAYNLARSIFACHMSTPGGDKSDKTIACAGYILMQGAHNLSFRLTDQRFEVSANGLQLFPTYRLMAIANGVKANDPCLRPCRDDGQTQ